MRVNISREAQQKIGKAELTIITERVDDVALLIGQMIKMGYPDILDKHIPKQGKQRELSWGWTATIWLVPYLENKLDNRREKRREQMGRYKRTALWHAQLCG